MQTMRNSIAKAPVLYLYCMCPLKWSNIFNKIDTVTHLLNETSMWIVLPCSVGAFINTLFDPWLSFRPTHDIKE